MNEKSKITKEGIHNFINQNFPKDMNKDPRPEKYESHKAMKDINYLRMVREFHRAFVLPVRNTPHDFTADDFELRLNVLKEELQEMEDSAELETHEFHLELLDALCDLQYVLSGAVLQLGFKDVFDEAMIAVHESNMSKVIQDEQDVELELMKYKKQGIPCRSKRTKYGWVIKRSSDGKILKPSGYAPVDLTPFLQILNDS